MPTFQPGQIILAKYRIESLLGTGTFGEVYRVTHLELNIQRAIKILRKDFPGVGSTVYQQAGNRFRIEVQLAAQFNHPNIVQVYDFERDGETLILVMEYVSGGSLQDVLTHHRENNTAVPVMQAVRWIQQAAEGLAELHQRDIIHRDLKPSNILIGSSGQAKIADLGLAQTGSRLGNESSLLQEHPGTPAYMSPEQASTKTHLPPPSDVYSLGLVLFELLTGRNAKNLRPGTRPGSIRPDIPQWLDTLLLQMLDENPHNRPWDGKATAEAIQQGLLSERQITEEKQQRQTQEKARREAEDKARHEAAAQERARKEREEQQRQAQERAIREAEEKARREEAAQERKRQERQQQWNSFWRKRGSWVAILVVLIPATIFFANSAFSSGNQSLPTPTQPVAQLFETATAAPAHPQPTQAPAAPAASAGTMDYSKVGPELADAFAGKFKGTTVTMAGPFTDNDAVKFNDSMKDFTDKTGINVVYTGEKEFEAVIRTRFQAGDAPDIVDFPQPGLLTSFAKTGYVLDLGKIINSDWLKQNYKQSWLDMGTMDGPNGKFIAGIWARAIGKDLVWYPKAAFDKAGYKVPNTWDEMMALTDQIAKDGDTPWCIGIESGAATGWAMTDWIEALMLRTTTPENYDKWVAGTLKFDSPEVRRALDYITKIWFQDKYVYGGRNAIATTYFGDAPKPMFDNPPKCWLHKQSDFITILFPEGKKAGVDYDFFYLPTIDPQFGKPFEVAGDIYAAFRDRPEVRAVIQYFTTGESLKGWIEAGGAISPHNDSHLDWYKDPVTRKIAEIMQTATLVRFDGSDLMPGVVGTGSFWKSMTDFVSNNIDEDTALQQIDASWPK